VLVRMLVRVVCVGSMISWNLLGGCSSGDGTPSGADGGMDAGTDGSMDASLVPLVSTPIELGLLPGDDPDRPFNHSTEPTIAVSGEHVVIAFINLGLVSKDSFEYPIDLLRRVAVASSHDGGETFGQAIAPQLGDDTSDPVVRTSGNGDFFLSVVDPETDIVLGKSTDHGKHWAKIAAFPGYDKEWLAVSDAQQRLYVGCHAGYWAFDFDGAELFRADGGGLHNAAFADEDGAHFAVGGGRAAALVVMGWNPPNALVQEGEALAMGVDDTWNDVAVSMGPTQGGGHWVVRAVETGGYHQVVWRRRVPPDYGGQDVPITQPQRNAFIPAGAVDDSGRLYVVWYETDENSGRLRLARSLSSEWAEGFCEPIVVDASACPGNFWFPSMQEGANDRRLREYIDMAVQGNVAYVVWTHAPVPPARVRTVRVVFSD